MFKKEMNERIIFHLKNYFEPQGYKLKKTGEVIFFVKKLSTGFQQIGISSDNYYDTHYLSFGYGKRINEIEKIMVELEEQFEPNFFYLRKDNATYYLNVANDVTLPDWIKKEVKTEQDVKRIMDWIIEYTKDYAFDKFDFLDNLYRVDKTINGNGENFWYDDDKKEFGMNRFDVRRIIIAKLVKSPEEYKGFVDKLMAIEDIRIEEIRQSDEKYKDLKNWFVPKIVTHLDEIVK